LFAQRPLTGVAGQGLGLAVLTSPVPQGTTPSQVVQVSEQTGVDQAQVELVDDVGLHLAGVVVTWLLAQAGAVPVHWQGVEGHVCLTQLQVDPDWTHLGYNREVVEHVTTKLEERALPSQ